MAGEGGAPIAAILAGGASRRMGRDKAEVVLGGQTSLERVRASCAAAGVETLVVGGGRPGAVEDLAPGEGPLQAVISAMRAAPGRAVVVLACDMPFVTSSLVRALAAPLGPGESARVARLGGEAQPMAMRLEAAALGALEAAWEGGVRSLKRALGPLSVAWLDVEALGDDAALGARDFDTPADLAQLAAEAGVAPMGAQR